jgi:hypothetical protein
MLSGFKSHMLSHAGEAVGLLKETWHKPHGSHNCPHMGYNISTVTLGCPSSSTGSTAALPAGASSTAQQHAGSVKPPSPINTTQPTVTTSPPLPLVVHCFGQGTPSFHRSKHPVLPSVKAPRPSIGQSTPSFHRSKHPVLTITTIMYNPSP